MKVCLIIGLDQQVSRTFYMGLANDIHVRPAGLHVSVSGAFSLDDARRTFLEIIHYVDEHNIEKILFDGRGIKGDPSAIDRFYYGEFAALAVQRLKDTYRHKKEPYLKEPYFAYVLLEPVADPGRLGETVAINRGMNVKVHETVDAALMWLGVTAEELLVESLPLQRTG